MSLNVGVTNLAFDAVNLGYQVVIPRDAVAGVPADYAQAVLDNTLHIVATLTTTAEVVRGRSASRAASGSPSVGCGCERVDVRLDARVLGARAGGPDRSSASSVDADRSRARSFAGRSDALPRVVPTSHGDTG